MRSMNAHFLTLFYVLTVSCQIIGDNVTSTSPKYEYIISPQYWTRDEESTTADPDGRSANETKHDVTPNNETATIADPTTTDRYRTTENVTTDHRDTETATITDPTTTSYYHTTENVTTEPPDTETATFTDATTTSHYRTTETVITDPPDAETATITDPTTTGYHNTTENITSDHPDTVTATITTATGNRMSRSVSQTEVSTQITETKNLSTEFNSTLPSTGPMSNSPRIHSSTTRSGKTTTQITETGSQSTTFNSTLPNTTTMSNALEANSPTTRSDNLVEDVNTEQTTLSNSVKMYPTTGSGQSTTVFPNTESRIHHLEPRIAESDNVNSGETMTHTTTISSASVVTTNSTVNTFTSASEATIQVSSEWPPTPLPPCKDGFVDRSPHSNKFPGEKCFVECPDNYCTNGGHCHTEDNKSIYCTCQNWNMGDRCQYSGIIVFSILGVVVVLLMIVVACAASAFCGRRALYYAEELEPTRFIIKTENDYSSVNTSAQSPTGVDGEDEPPPNNTPVDGRSRTPQCNKPLRFTSPHQVTWF